MRSEPKHTSRLTLIGLILILVMLSSFVSISSGRVYGQFPTVSIPTVTGSPRGAYVIGKNTSNNEYIPVNVRIGPNILYDLVGVLLAGQEANAIGQYGDWIQIEYIGGDNGRAWVYAANVFLYGGPLPQVQPPPTKTPSITKTINPTLAAQFILPEQATRLPTFTEPAPLQIPTFQAEFGTTAPGGIPIGFVIVILAGLGLFLTLVAILRRG